MDIIDDVIRHLGLRSRVAYRYERAGECVDTRYDSALLQLHCVLEGSCRYRVDTPARDHRLRAGDILLLPCGGRVELLGTMSAAAMAPCPPAARVLVLGVEVELAGHGHHPLFDGLPRVIVVGDDALRASGTARHAGHLIAGSGDCEAGRQSAIIDRLVEILLIQTIKAYQATGGDRTLFVAALVDPAVGRALAAIHRAPGHNWSLERLAQAAGLARSTFSRRFTELAGVPAMHYLTTWRMHLALQQLRTGNTETSDIARSVGYQSPTAFQKAFKRIHGVTPTQASMGGG